MDGRGEDARPGCEDIPDDGARYARTSESAPSGAAVGRMKKTHAVIGALQIVPMRFPRGYFRGSVPASRPPSEPCAEPRLRDGRG